jgi:hypothetical protein
VFVRKQTTAGNSLLINLCAFNNPTFKRAAPMVTKLTIAAAKPLTFIEMNLPQCIDLDQRRLTTTAFHRDLVMIAVGKGTCGLFINIVELRSILRKRSMVTHTCL